MSTVRRTIEGKNTCDFQSKVNKAMDALWTVHSATKGVECRMGRNILDTFEQATRWMIDNDESDADTAVWQSHCPLTLLWCSVNPDTVLLVICTNSSIRHCNNQSTITLSKCNRDCVHQIENIS
ncbi:hypothetical protein TNCV_3470911 [Trichonephila clavipes]|nr:hypothetical protein TNCV_3470911 [Trichonephila clavipes]